MTQPQPLFFAGHNETEFLIWDTCEASGTTYYFLLLVDSGGLTLGDLTRIKNAPREIIEKLKAQKGVLVPEVSSLVKDHPQAFLVVFSITPNLQIKVSTNGRFYVWLVRDGKYAELISGKSKTVGGTLKSHDKVFFSPRQLTFGSEMIKSLTQAEGVTHEILAQLVSTFDSGVLGLTIPPVNMFEKAVETPPVPVTGTFPAVTLVNNQQVNQHVKPKIQLPLVQFVKSKTVAFLDWLISKLNRNDEIFVKSFTTDPETVNKKRSNLFLVGVLLVVLFGVSVVFGSVNQKLKKERLALTTSLGEINRLLVEAETVSGVDISHARELYRKANELFLGLKVKETPEVMEVGQKLTTLQKTITREYAVGLSDFLDLNLIEENFNPDLSCFCGGKLYLGRKNLGTGVIFTVETKKKEQEFRYNGLVDTQRMFCGGGKLFLATKSEVLVFEGGLFKKILTIDRDGLIFGAYGTNLYAVDAPNSIIYRYPGITGGFGERSLWLQPGQKVDLSDTTTLAIDGSLWVGGMDGNVLKFTQGRMDIFKSESGTWQMRVDSLIVDEQLTNVYVFDSKQGLFMVLDKKGLLLAVYKADTLKDKSLVAVVENNKKAFFQDGSKLVSLELVH